MQKTFLICAVLVMTTVMVRFWKFFYRITSEVFRVALKSSQEVRMRGNREAKDKDKEGDPVEVVVVLLVVLDSAALAALVARVELEPVPTNE
jgi:hypothetical protein